MFKAQMTEADTLAMISHSTEFEQIKVPNSVSYCDSVCDFVNVEVREDEIGELSDLMHESCTMLVRGGVENAYGKVNILLQSYISRAPIDTFSLVSDMAYVAQVSQ